MFALEAQPGTDGCIYFFLTSQPLRILYSDYRCTGFAGAKSERSTYLKKKTKFKLKRFSVFVVDSGEKSKDKSKNIGLWCFLYLPQNKL